MCVCERLCVRGGLCASARADCIFESTPAHVTCLQMSELIYSRCKVCTPHLYQCKACSSSDKKTISLARSAKKQQLSALPPTNLFPSHDPLPVLDPVAPANSTVAAPSPPLALVAPAIAAARSGKKISSPPCTPKFTEVVFAPSSPLSPLDYEDDHVFPPLTAPAHLSFQGETLFPVPFCPAIPLFPVPASIIKRVRSHDEFSLDSEFNSGTDAKSDASTTDGDEDDETAAVASVASKTKGTTRMDRITKEERTHVCTWIQKRRKDDKMTNGRWIRNGGAKGQTMTATSGEVKTSGAYDALATYTIYFIVYALCHPFPGMSTRD